MQGEHSHDAPPVPVVAPVIEKTNELVAPVVDHTEKITRIEERQAQHQEEMMRQLSGLEERLASATGSQIDSLQRRIVELEAKIAETAAPVIPDDSVELTLPEIEPSPAPPEKVRSGMRHRRLAKRKAKK